MLKRTADHMPSKIELGLVKKISHLVSELVKMEMRLKANHILA